MKHLFIVNPAAGKGKTLQLIPEIKKIFAGRSDEPLVEITEKPGHATELVKSYVSKEHYRVYSVGGDGTVNEVVNGLVGSGSSLAVIPAGTGNDFIKNFTNVKDLHHILLHAVDGTEKCIDLGRVNGRYFVNISSIGLDAMVAYNMTRFKKLPLVSGAPAYILGLLSTLFSFDSYPLKIAIDGEYIEKKSLLIAIANGRYYGGGIKAAPHASLEDGKFDICLVREMGKLEILKFFPKYAEGRHSEIEGIRFYRGQKIEISGSIPMALNIDGEVQMAREAVFEILPEALRLVVPK